MITEGKSRAQKKSNGRSRKDFKKLPTEEKIFKGSRFWKKNSEGKCNLKTNTKKRGKSPMDSIV